MTEAQLNLLIMAVATLLPIVPAVFLFRGMKSSATASGPFQGFKVRLGGAFAGYFVVFLVLLSVRPKDLSHYHSWTVVGSVTFDHPGEPDPNVNDVFVRFVPPRLGIMNQGLFSWEIPVIEDANGQLHFPDLQLDLRGFRGITIPLGQSHAYGANLQAQYDTKQRVISLTQPIVMQSEKSATPYVEKAAGNR